MAKVFLGLGSNIGNKVQNINDAIERLKLTIGHLEACSSFYESEPLGFKSSDRFVNAVAQFETNMQPLEILNNILRIEKELGRERVLGKVSSRTIDIDILLIDDIVQNSVKLILPHPRLHERKFVLLPLNEIAPDFRHPVFSRTISDLLSKCVDSTQPVRLL